MKRNAIHIGDTREVLIMKKLEGAHNVKTLRGLRGKLMRERNFSASEYRDWTIEKANSWLCQCGNWITDGQHCPICYSEPPWGCDCSACRERALDAIEPEYDGFGDPYDDDLDLSK